ncbi:uncharacterized protein LOC127510041 isoform X10 [Ctenopharyngodon idella]|uniref:uncharacterized protein LOC127510041 isoform X9 n=1 Tax=Ctenopharyngodon idella TaxID=7959 RepID=UPI00222F0195|nr:uncharacterized protein LOC127510041 isoform X9 [Ctenopharyngodon idella]XP_051745505.1 uncharacterized protein LOC127510041 isoform X10 [Ctenopharyngodon idella]
MKNVSKTCGEIQTDDGFEYRLQALNQTLSGDCEHSWYSEDGRLLADPSNPHRLMYPVTSVSSDRLVTSYCVDELRYEIQCHSKRITHETMFRVFNDTNSSGGSTQTPDSHQFWWISVLVIFLLAFLCFMLRKRIFRCFLKAEASDIQRNDSEIRDPESAVQKKLRSDESDSLNHSESEQINSSCPEDHPVITLNVIH